MGFQMEDTDRNESRASGVIYRFGLFALDVRALSLTRNGLRIKLQDQPFQLLAFLLEKERPGCYAEELRQQLWPGNTFVDFDKSLGVAVLKVREALGDSAANPTFLETLPRRGYRFIAPVTLEPDPGFARWTGRRKEQNRLGSLFPRSQPRPQFQPRSQSQSQPLFRKQSLFPGPSNSDLAAASRENSPPQATGFESRWFA